MNLQALALVLLVCIFEIAPGYSQQILGNCLCNSTDHTNYEPDDECIPTGSCQDNRAPDPDAFFWGCRIFITPNPSTLTSEMLIQQSCISNALDNSIFCMPSTEEERDANVIVTLDLNVLSICCFQDNCNSFELLSSTIESRPDLKEWVERISATTAPTIMTKPPPTSAPLYAILSISILAVILVMALTVIAVGVVYHYRKCLLPLSPRTVKVRCTSPGIIPPTYICPEEREEGSGSGSGLPLLVHRSIAEQINLHELIGKGRYGRVYKATYRLDDVAVKVFHTVEKASWSHEVDIYQTCLFHHPNILRFVASDSKDCGSQVELWLITEYCEHGSLYDLLIQRTYEPEKMLKLAYTAVSGLDHLHTEIFGHDAKPAIVHRDLKSRNILVKGDYTCCIGDLGLALRYDRKNDQVEDPPSKKVGTKRYLAPEIIDDSISMKQFELFKMADIYSFGLILWEIALRGEVDGTGEEYLMPYQNMVPQDPSFEDMKKVVVVEKKRPPLPNKWNQSEVFVSMSKLIQQCWLHDSDARPTSQRLKRNINNVQQAYFTQKKDGEHSGGK